MAWWFAVVEARHDIQDPTSPEKIRLLGERVGLSAGAHVLDMAAGRGGPALVLAQAFGCRVTCVEMAEAFAAVARQRVAAAGLQHHVEIVQSDARDFRIDRDRYDVAMCLGASFIWDGLENTVAALAPAVRSRGFLVVGEPYWKRWPLPQGFEPVEGEDFTTFAETAERFEATGLELVTSIAASDDDWDRYESLHWLVLDEWLAEHPDHPQAAEFRERGRLAKQRYLRWERDLIGWAIFVGRRRD